MSGRLFLVATPIGCDDDLSLRGRRVLSEVGLIAAEDTRVTLGLLRRLGIRPPKLLSTHDHNERGRAPQIVALLAEGTDIALVSDAGTPLVSDPGYPIVQAALAADHPVVPVPGPSAVLAALSASGLPTDRFTFHGFLPRAAGKRSAALEEACAERGTAIWYESPRRIRATLQGLALLAPERACALAISLTKEWERWHRGSPDAIDEALAREEVDGPLRGEMTLLIAGAVPSQGLEARSLALVGALIQAGLGPGQIRDALCPILGLPKRAVYQAALERSQDADRGSQQS